MALSYRDRCRARVTVVSDEFIDEHMAKASGEYVKVYLYLLRHEGEDVTAEDIAAALDHTEADVRRALRYWEKAGVLEAESAGAAEPRAESRAASREAGAVSSHAADAVSSRMADPANPARQMGPVRRRPPRKSPAPPRPSFWAGFRRTKTSRSSFTSRRSTWRRCSPPGTARCLPIYTASLR